MNRLGDRIRDVWLLIKTIARGFLLHRVGGGRVCVCFYCLIHYVAAASLILSCRQEKIGRKSSSSRERKKENVVEWSFRIALLLLSTLEAFGKLAITKNEEEG